MTEKKYFKLILLSSIFLQAPAYIRTTTFWDFFVTKLDMYFFEIKLDDKKCQQLLADKYPQIWYPYIRRAYIYIYISYNRTVFTKQKLHYRMCKEFFARQHDTKVENFCFV